MRPSGRPARRPERTPSRRPVTLPARLVRQLRRRGTLTGLGAGVATTVPTLAVGAAESALRGGPGVLFELAFLGSCTVGALHVRRSDLPAAPISAPIAFAVTMVVTVGFGGGGGNALLAVVAALSSSAPWLFAGTLLAAVLVGVRFLMAPRQPRQRMRMRGRAPDEDGTGRPGPRTARSR